MPPVSEIWLQVLRLLALTVGARMGWAAVSHLRGRRRVREARRALMRSGALVDAGGLGRGVHAGMAYRVHAEPRGNADPIFVCRVPVGELPLAFSMRPSRGEEVRRPARRSLSPRFDARYLVEAAPADVSWRRVLPVAQRHRAEGLCDLEAELVGEALEVRQPRVRAHEAQRVVRFATELAAALLEAAEPNVLVASRPLEAGYRAAPRVETAVAACPPVVGALRRELWRRRRRRSHRLARQGLTWVFAFYGAVAVWLTMYA